MATGSRKKSKPTTEHVASSSVRKNHFRFRLWHGLVLIILIIVVGVVIIRFSHASSPASNVPTPTVITQSDMDRYQAQFGSKGAAARTVSGEVDLTYVPKSGVRVATVAYYVDENLQTTSNQAPYAYQLNTLALKNGQHAVSAVVYDNSSVVVGFHSQAINVQNGAGLDGLRSLLIRPWQVIFGQN